MLPVTPLACAKGWLCAHCWSWWDTVSSCGHFPILLRLWNIRLREVEAPCITLMRHHSHHCLLPPLPSAKRSGRRTAVTSERALYFQNNSEAHAVTQPSQQ
jgi:hypothetical protein